VTRTKFVLYLLRVYLVLALAAAPFAAAGWVPSSDPSCRHPQATPKRADKRTIKDRRRRFAVQGGCDETASESAESGEVEPVRRPS
jgi:hypothetical protein